MNFMIDISASKIFIAVLVNAKLSGNITAVVKSIINPFFR